MKYFSHRDSLVAIFLEVLWEGGEVPSSNSPIGVEIIEACCVWPSAGQKRRPTRPTYSLLEKVIIKKSQRK